MFNKQTLIFFALISFSLQDNNCLVNFEYCEEEEEQKRTVTIKNCKESNIYGDIEECVECDTHYYVSEDRRSCIQVKDQIENCISYYADSENEFCYRCDKGYALSTDYKKCTKVENPIEHCVYFSFIREGEIGCNECEKDYYPSYDRTHCIEFKNCNYFINYEKNEHCEYCKRGYALSYDGKSCIQSKTCKKFANKDNTKCSECISNFHPNANGECERTLCSKYDENVCTECYEGYYLDGDKNCKKITIENCLYLDEKNEKCESCLFGITPDANGKCNLPSTLIKGCIKYGSDGKCIECEDEGDVYQLKDGTCKFIDCKKGETKLEYCGKCKPGYDFEENDNGNYICLGYDGSYDTSSDSSSRNKVEYALLIFILALLI